MFRVLPRPLRSPYYSAAAVLCAIAPAPLAEAAPTVAPDTFQATEDQQFTASAGPIFTTDFDGPVSGVVDNTWDYLDKIENQNGAAHGYPTDAGGRAWNNPTFNIGSSTIGSWSTGTAPLQAGSIDAFPGAADVLEGIDDASNGENLVTTYLFRNSFTLNAAEASISDWDFRHVFDDAAIVYINGTEVFRTSNMPAGVPTTQTLASFSTTTEGEYVTAAGVSLAGLLVTGTNYIAVEVHQGTLSSSDVGFDVIMEQPTSGVGDFVYVDDPFPAPYATSAADYEDGEISATGGFGGTAGLNVNVGRRSREAVAGAWRLPLTLGSAATVNVSFRYRLVQEATYESNEFSYALFAADGVFYGNGGQDYIAVHQGDGNTGSDLDTGWQTFEVDVPLSAGAHDLDFGTYNNNSTAFGEVTDVYIDDLVIGYASGGSGGGVLENDSGDGTMTAALATPPSDGSVAFNADGTFTYTPDANFDGTDTFTYTATDTSGTSAPVTVTINVASVNDPPTAGARAETVAEDGSLDIQQIFGLGLQGDDIDGDALSFSLDSDVSNGTLVLAADGGFTYAPDTDFAGTDSFTYVADDGSVQSDPATVTINVTPVNDPPSAVDDAYTTAENFPLEVNLSGAAVPVVVLSESFDGVVGPVFSGVTNVESVGAFAGLGDPDGFSGSFLRNRTSGDPADTTTITIAGLPEHDEISIGFLLAMIDSWDGDAGDTFNVSVDGQLVFSQTFENAGLNTQGYTPPAGGELARMVDLGFTTGDLFVDSAYDMSLEPALQGIPHSADQVVIEIYAAGGDWSGGDDESWAIDQLEVSVVDLGLVSLVASGSDWSYQDNGTDQGTAWRAAGFNDSSWASGSAQLGYGDGDEATTVSFGDDEGNKRITTYFRHKFNVDDPDDLVSLSIGLIRDDGAAVYINGAEVVRSNLDADPAFDDLATATVGGADESTFYEFTADSSVLVAGENVVAVEIHQVNVSSSDISFDLRLMGQTLVNLGVIANDNDVDGPALSVVVDDPPDHGSVALNADGSFIYTPDVNYDGTDTFAYTLSDGTLTDTGEVTITITPGPNAFPETVADIYATAEDTPLLVATAEGVLDNDSDPEGDPMTATVATEPANGTLFLFPQGGFSYTPNLNFNGPDTFTYIANDGTNDSGVTPVTINVTPVNDRPVADADSFLAAPGVQLVTAAPGVLDGDTDGDGDTLTAQLVANPASGSLSLQSDGGFTYTPAAGFSGQVTFSYRASDGALNSDPTTVTIDVNGAPTAEVNAYSVAEDQTLNVHQIFGVLSNDTDPENDPLTASIAVPASNGQASVTPAGAVTYTPNADFHGTDTFTYTANDGLQNSVPATVTITVTPVDDPPVAADDEYVVLVEQTATVDAVDGVLDNDSDIEDDPMSASLVDDAANGTLALAADGSFTYTPQAGFSGTDTFTYTADAAGKSSAPATVTLLVGAASESVLISELMFHPASDNDAEEFIELTNIGSIAVPLAGWTFTSGLTFDFPSVSIPPGGQVVVAADPAAFIAAYGAGPIVVGPWDGRLSNSGERIRIEDNFGREVDDITYSDQGDWARRRAETLGGEDGWRWDNPADGGGSSLELVNLEISNKHGQNWLASNGAPTPGASNSVASNETAPLVRKVKHSPAIPRPGETVTVNADISDEDGEPLTATLHWRVSVIDPGAFTSAPMFDDGLHGDGDAGDGEFGAQVPGAGDGTVIEFYVEGSDGTNSRTWPAPTDEAGTQGANALFQFDGEAYTGNQPIYRFIMTAEEDDAFRFSNFNGNSDAQMNTTLVARQGSDTDIRYLCGVRVRGAGSRSRNPRNNRLNIPRDDAWNGVSKINLNTQFVYLQLMGSKLASASGVEAADAKPVQLRHNGVNRADDNQVNRRYGSFLHIEPIDGDWAERHYPDDRDGNLYSKGRPDVKWDVHTSGGGPDIAAYISDGWSKTSNESANDWNDLHNLFITMNGATGAGYLDLVDEVIDHDQWARWFAYMTIVLSRETNLSNGADDDYKMYSGVNDPRFKLVPHDFDTIFGLGDTSTNPTDTLFPAITSFAGQTWPQLVPFFDDPTIARLHYAHMKELLGTVFSKAEFDATVANCLDWVPQSVRDDIISFMDARRAFILSEIPSTFSVTSSLAVVGGVSQADEADVTGLSGTIDAAKTASVRVNGTAVAIDNRNGTWSGESVNQDSLLPAGAIWQYLDDGSDQGTAWRAPAFDDSSWKTGVAELGYGGRGEVTVVDYGPDPANKHITTYFRTTFEVADPASYGTATLRLIYDDAAAVFVNGVEVLRRNLGADALYDEFASATVTNAEFEDYVLPVSSLQAGTNTIAIEIHNVALDNIDISMDAEILASQSPLALDPGLNNLLVEALDADGKVIDSSYFTVWFDDGSTTDVSGTLAGNTTWSAAGGPYTVTGDIIVPVGVTLTIEPGTSIFFADGTRMTVRGQLLAEGTQARHIVFAQQPGTTGGWDGVYFDGTTSDNRMVYVDQDGSDSGSHSVEVTNSRLLLDHVRWTGTTETILEVSGPQLTVSGCDFPSSSGQEAIHGASLGGSDYFNLIGNVFQTSSGYNDIIDFSGGRRPGPIIYVVNNVFTGGTDDCLDLDGIDAHIEGNVFMNIHTDDPSRESTSNAIATDGSAHMTVVRNLFYDVDHALLLKNNADAIFENNTIVGATIAAINFDEPIRTGVVPGDAITMRGNIFYNNAATFANQFAAAGEDDPVIVADLNILPVAHHGLGTGNIDADPMFADAAGNDFTLTASSPAIGAGVNGADMGYDVPAGATISGEPPAVTRESGATLAVHMPGISGIESGSFTTEYRWRLNGGAWSSPVPVTTPITLSGLDDGLYTVEVIGKDSAGYWQEESAATVSQTWTVDNSLTRLLISEVLANNSGAYDHEGTFPDIIEIWNDSASPRDVSSMALADENFRPGGWSFPQGTVIPAGERLLVFGNAADGTSGLHCGFGLDDDGEGVFLFETAANGGGLIDSVEFGFQLPGVSISRTGHDGSFAATVPTPGDPNGPPLLLGAPGDLVINEWLATNGIVYDNDFLELYNPGGLPVALSGLTLTDDPNNDPGQHPIAPLSFIDAGGFVKFIADNDPSQGPSHLSFNLSKLIESVALFDSGGGLIDRVMFNNGIDDTSKGRATDGSLLFADFPLPTPGFSNGTDLSAETLVLQSLRIIEMDYHPVAGSEHEYMKLQNVGSQPISLAGVQFDEGITFEFPDVTLAAGEIAYIASDQARFIANFGLGANLLGSYTGQLSNGGERIRLEIASLSAGILDFEYKDDWYPSTDGGGDSLLIVDPLGARSEWSLKSGWQASGTPGQSYDNWVIEKFGGPAAGITDKTDDPDNDGIENIWEFVLLLDPNGADPVSALPELTVENNFLTLTYTTAYLPSEVVLGPQISSTLETWSDAGAGVVSVQLMTDDGTRRTYKATDSVPITPGQARFLRLRVDCP